MKILIAHVRYRLRGGEDVVVDSEAALLREAGHEVALVDPSSIAFDSLPLGTRLEVGLRAGDHRYGRVLISRAILAHCPDVVHFHNLYPLLGPGAIAEAARLGCATVQTLHNYRLSCVAGTHYRDGAVCEECSPGRHVRGVRYGCYRQSRVETWWMARALDAQFAGLVARKFPHVVVCLTEFMRDRLLSLGVPRESLIVKPNSVPPSTRRVPFERRNGAVYVGRLSREKGVRELVCAWPGDAPPLVVIGTGPLEAELRKIAGSNVALTGALSPAEVRTALSASRVAVIPSTCFEGLPTVALESFAEMTPVVGFGGGALGPLLVEQGPETVAGYLDWVSLVESSVRICTASRQKWNEWSEAAYSLYEAHFTERTNLASLESIYSLAIRRLHERERADG